MIRAPHRCLFFLLLAACATGVMAQTKADTAGLNTRPRVVSSNPQLTNDAIRYYRELTIKHSVLNLAKYNYLKAVTKSRRVRDVEKTRQELLKTLQGVIDHCKASAPFRGDSTLKSELGSHLNLFYLDLKEDFDKILDMEDIKAQSYDQEEAHQLAMDMAVDKMNTSFAALKKADNDFFATYQINSVEDKDELTLKIKKVERALEYYNAICRIINRADRQNGYAQQSVESKDLAGLEQNAVTLVTYAEEGLEKMKQQAPYEGDGELLTAAMNQLEFFKYKGQVVYPANVDFEMKADNLEKARKKLESIKRENQTKQDIDRFNELVNQFNNAVKAINKTSHDSFEKHKKLIEDWKKKVDKFLDKHS
jgi:hypothetical protein